MKAFDSARYDYTVTSASGFYFWNPSRNQGESVSINEGACISDRESFNWFEGKNSDDYSIEAFEETGRSLLGKRN